MKEDYLWDKTGDDAGIEQLENALAAFRYQPDAPPALEQKILTLAPPARRNFFRFAFPAFAGFAALVVILSVVWFQFSGTRTSPVVETVKEANELKRAEKTADNSFVAPRTSVETIKAFEEDKPSLAPKIVKVRQTITRRREKTAARRSKKFVEPEEPLTKEEQFAYDQLMLALTITGSKLKIVQDKINGVEEQNAVVEK